MWRIEVVQGEEKRVRHRQRTRGNGERGIRTLDTRFHVCRFSKPVPSASRPSLQEVTQAIPREHLVQVRDDHARGGNCGLAPVKSLATTTWVQLGASAGVSIITTPASAANPR